MSRTRVGVLISGRGSNMRALAAAAEAADCPFALALVASDKPDAAGLGWATEQKLATFALSPQGIGKAAYEDALDAALRDAGVEVIALAGYMRLLSDAFVARWRGRIVNIHPSLLPLYKGLDTHARAIAAGDRIAGCSVHVVTEELDGGAVLGQAEVPILPGDDADTLAARVLAQEHRLYPRVLAAFTRDRMTNCLQRVRDAALTLPETAERLSSGRMTFVVADEPFAQLRDDPRGDGRTALCVRTSGADELTKLIEGEPGRYSRPTSPGPDSGGPEVWVAMDLTGDVNWTDVEDRVARSWELVAPRRLLEAGGR